jgi:hypothetical protein
LTRFYIKLILPIAFACLIFTLIARAIGTTQPPNPALRGFVEGCEDKPQPCWYGIVPGITTIGEAKIILTTNDYWERPKELVYYGGSQYVNISEAPSCVNLVRYEGEEVLSGITLRCLGIRLGDVISYWGIPRDFGYGEVRTIDGFGYPGYAARLHRSDYQPHLWMYEIYLYIPSENLNEQPFIGDKWHGFAPIWRYCQLEDILWLCRRPALLSTPPINKSTSSSDTPLPTLPPG